jgi:predicted short-subunit dehydrogenase-like oxidoreductase (DUF2520 family)
MAERFSFRVALIGSGRLGTQLAMALEKGGHRIAEIFNPSQKSAEKLAYNLYSSQLVNSLDFSDSDCNFFVIAVPDEAIEQVATEIVLPDEAIIVHTSGATPMSILEVTAAENFGVIWPLQSFSHGATISFSQLPVIIEGANDYTLEILNRVVASIGAEPVFMEEEERKNLHVAAVFASNFTNFMLRSAERVLEKDDISLDILKPLVVETIRKAFEIGPENAQTGPAAREDFTTIDAQTLLLGDDESLQRMYRMISQEIIDSKYESDV